MRVSLVLRRRLRIACGVAALGSVIGCGPSGAPPAGSDVDAHGHTAPSRATEKANAGVAKSLPLERKEDFDDANRGFVGRDDPLRIVAADGRVVWDTAAAKFVDGDAPASVNPSLWRQAKLTNVHGLFQVAEGIYQVRGYDVSNMTLIRGRSGWIVVDPLTCTETAAAAMALARRHLGDVRVAAVIFTHSHVDHFGGVDAVLPADPAARAAIRIIAPRDFLEEATSENVLAGITMSRRASYMYGLHLATSPRGHVTTGLGQAPARGQVGIARPTDLVDHTPQEIVVDGLPMIFQYVPDSEAPAELTFYVPSARAFCGAEIVSHTMHNLYTLRGAKVRDALRWSRYVDEAIRLFGNVDVVFASHHWPVWGHERVVGYLERQRDVYAYLHDQTLRLASSGATPQEIADAVELPASLRDTFATRGYYGTVRHNVKGVYQWYFGWYDGNPAHLDPLAPVEAGRRYVEAMGGPEAVLAKAQAAFEAADYRWAAMLLDHLVFAKPDRADARELLARTYDQLGYQAESGPWRDVYLSGAREARHGVGPSLVDLAALSGLFREMPIERFFDALATRLNGPRADGKDITINIVLTDVGESFVLQVRNSVLHHRRQEPLPGAEATVRLTKDLLLRIFGGQAGMKDTLMSDDLAVDGSRLALVGFFGLLDQPDPAFEIVTP